MSERPTHIEAAAPRDDPLDLRMVPLALATWVGAWWGTAPRIGVAVMLAGIAMVSVPLWRRRAPMIGVATLLVLSASMANSAVRTHQLQSSPLAQQASQHASVELVVRVRTDAVMRPRQGVMPESATLEASTQLYRLRGALTQQRVDVQVRASGERTRELVGLPVGSVVRLHGRLEPGDEGRRQVVRVTLQGQVALVQEAGRWDQLMNRVRAGLKQAASHNPEVQAGLMPSLVVGDTSGLDPSLSEDFKATGLSHLCAVSGTNLTLLLVALTAALKVLGVRGWAVRASGLVSVVVFVSVCRAEPSVVRAAAMGLVALAGLGLAQGRARGLRHAATAVTVLMLIDPWLARSVGFALSTSATVGILWWAGRWARTMSWAPGWLAESVVVPLAAQLATQPITTALSGQVSVVSLAANALAAPWVGPATVLGLVSAVVSLLSPALAVVPAWIAGWCVQPIIWIARFGAALPAATWVWPTTTLALVLLAVACWAASALVPRLLARRWLCMVVALLMVLACWRQPRPMGWPGQWKVVFCDVGQGDATALFAGQGQAVLVDVGPDDSAARCLRDLGVRSIPLLVLTHYHDDHIAGLEAVLKMAHVSAAMVNPSMSPRAGAERATSLLRRHGASLRQAQPGERLRVGQVDWQTAGVSSRPVLAAAGEGESSAENDSSIVGLASSGGVRVVIGGDVEPAGQQEIVARGWDPGATVLKMPHHGSSRQDERFWCDSGARVAVASAGRRNSYGHPAAKALRLAASCGMSVLRTDQDGSIAMWREDDQLQVRRHGADR